MKQKSGIILLFVVLALTWACSSGSLLKEKEDKSRQDAGTATSDVVAAAPSMPDVTGILTDSLKGIGLQTE